MGIKVGNERLKLWLHRLVIVVFHIFNLVPWMKWDSLSLTCCKCIIFKLVPWMKWDSLSLTCWKCIIFKLVPWMKWDSLSLTCWKRIIFKLVQWIEWDSLSLACWKCIIFKLVPWMKWDSLSLTCWKCIIFKFVPWMKWDSLSLTCWKFIIFKLVPWMKWDSLSLTCWKCIEHLSWHGMQPGRISMSWARHMEFWQEIGHKRFMFSQVQMPNATFPSGWYIGGYVRFFSSTQGCPLSSPNVIQVQCMIFYNILHHVASCYLRFWCLFHPIVHGRYLTPEVATLVLCCNAVLNQASSAQQNCRSNIRLADFSWYHLVVYHRFIAVEIRPCILIISNYQYTIDRSFTWLGYVRICKTVCFFPKQVVESV